MLQNTRKHQTVRELYAQLSKLIADGHGDKEIFATAPSQMFACGQLSLSIFKIDLDLDVWKGVFKWN